jgi:hypothetical protein
MHKLLSIFGVLLLLGALGCGSGHSAAAVPLREYPGRGAATIAPDPGQDATLLGEVTRAMAGRRFFLGLYHRFDTGAEQLTLPDQEFVGSDLQGVEQQDGPWDSLDGVLRVDTGAASYSEPLSRIPPVLSQLVLHGTFDAAALDAAVASLTALPFDPARPESSATSIASVPVHWQLTGLVNGLPFDLRFTQELAIVAVDAQSN